MARSKTAWRSGRAVEKVQLVSSMARTCSMGLDCIQENSEGFEMKV